jgi:hypothetical protein
MLITLLLPLLLAQNPTTHSPQNPIPLISDDEINKILKAKEKVRNMVNYPDTLVFHDLHTKVKGNTVTLKFTCKNAFGTPETHTMDINAD